MTNVLTHANGFLYSSKYKFSGRPEIANQIAAEPGQGSTKNTSQSNSEKFEGPSVRAVLRALHELEWNISVRSADVSKTCSYDAQNLPGEYSHADLDMRGR